MHLRESESQIKSRADRIINRIHSNVWVVSDNSMDNILENIDEVDPDFIIVDSIQTFSLEAFPGSRQDHLHRLWNVLTS